MGQQHEIDITQTEIERPEVLDRRTAPSLEHPAIDKKFSAVELNQRARSGHLTGGAVESDPHMSPFRDQPVPGKPHGPIIAYITVHREERPMFKHLLVPTDGSALSESTVARAVSFAKEAGARVTFFYAQPDFPMPIYGEGALIDPTTPEQFARAAAEEANAILSKAKTAADDAGTAADDAGVVADTDTLINEVPYEAIIDAANRHACDLIFMASHGRRGIAGLLLGSEATKVLTHWKIPVLIYR